LLYPEFREQYISARMIVSACRYCHIPLGAMIKRLPNEICQAVKDEEKRMFNTLKMPVDIFFALVYTPHYSDNFFFVVVDCYNEY
jgi:hypothetical protein